MRLSRSKCSDKSQEDNVKKNENKLSGHKKIFYIHILVILQKVTLDLRGACANFFRCGRDLSMKLLLSLCKKTKETPKVVKTTKYHLKGNNND